ncbi:hypothetical protein [Psychromonas aquimarina]|uniref:hypothetical protein n=1 Tax=Psychromonas aquimarina TaxID=444919 RepID=UPI000415163B|nr:hypothetical protein [Psychromonas aquimarina]
MFKLTTLALSVGIALLSSGANASYSVTKSDYEALLPSAGGAPDYSLKLADNTTVNYHCNIKEDGEDFVLDPETCEQRKLDWKGDYSKTVNISILDAESSLTIEEHKLWAMAFATSSMQSLVQMQYGLLKDGGTFDLNKKFNNGTEKFGEYFMRNMGPNYYLSKALQESSLGDDLNTTNGWGQGDDDGVLQVEYPGSGWAELQGAGSGGFPVIFESMNPESVLSSNNGPALNVLGSAVTSAYYNASVTGINTGSLEWHQNEAGQADPQNRLHEFIQGSVDPDVLSKMLSFMYNRGPYAAKDQPLKDEETFQHCMKSVDVANDWDCFTKQNDFGTRYIRQIPDVTKQLLASGSFYDAPLSWDDLKAYLTLLGNYGFYSSEDIQTIETAVREVFDHNQSGGVISYQDDFGKVLETMITAAPIKTFAEKGAVDPNKTMAVYVSDDIQASTMFMSATENGANVINDWLTPNTHISMPFDAVVQQLTYLTADCTNEFNKTFTASLPHVNPDDPIQLNIESDGTSCNIYESAYADPGEPPAVPEGEWDKTVVYNGGEKVKHNDVNFTASYYSLGREPGTGGEWNPEDGAAWFAAVPYQGGSKVTYQGGSYTAAYYSLGATPGTGAEWTAD